MDSQTIETGLLTTRKIGVKASGSSSNGSSQKRRMGEDEDHMEVEEIGMINGKPGSQGGQHPRKVLPTEIWDEVFSRVTDSKDWLHCFYASSVFQKETWLKWDQGRITHLFPGVIRILNSNKSLSELDYLTCRLVSKSWKTTIDEFLQYSTLQFCLSSSPDKPWVDLWTSIEFVDNPSHPFFVGVDYWLSQPQGTNPFPSRQLEFWDMHVRDDGNRTRLKLTTINFLNKFGHHLWYFSYHACRDDMFPSPLDWYLTVRSWLQVMPNLKKICLAFGGENHVLDNEMLLELEDIVRSHPFPKFDNLITLETEYLPYSVLNSAVTVNSQIKRLEQHPNSYRLPWTNYGSIDLSQLTEFTTQLYSMYDVHQLHLVNWPLQILNLRCWNVNLEQNWNFNEIVQAIEHFQGTLKVLKLEVTLIDDGVQLHLPLLETLEIECDNDGRNFVEFVACLKSLCKVSLSVDLSGNREHAAAVPLQNVVENRVERRIQSHFERMKIHAAGLFAVPLWGRLPQLKSVFVHTYVPPYRVQYDYTYKREEEALL